MKKEPERFNSIWEVIYYNTIIGRRFRRIKKGIVGPWHCGWCKAEHSIWVKRKKNVCSRCFGGNSNWDDVELGI